MAEDFSVYRSDEEKHFDETSFISDNHWITYIFIANLKPRK